MLRMKNMLIFSMLLFVATLFRSGPAKVDVTPPETELPKNVQAGI